jgi:hypothetical protein
MKIKETLYIKSLSNYHNYVYWWCSVSQFIFTKCTLNHSNQATHHDSHKFFNIQYLFSVFIIPLLLWAYYQYRNSHINLIPRTITYNSISSLFLDSFYHLYFSTPFPKPTIQKVLIHTYKESSHEIYSTNSQKWHFVQYKLVGYLLRYSNCFVWIQGIINCWLTWKDIAYWFLF